MCENLLEGLVLTHAFTTSIHSFLSCTVIFLSVFLSHCPSVQFVAFLSTNAVLNCFLVCPDSVVGSAAGGQKTVMRRPASDNRSPVTVKKFKADGEPML